jgi:type I restriction enzyme M protein
MDYSETFKKLREELGLSQEGLANLLGVARMSVIRWESGLFEPSNKILFKVRKLYEANGLARPAGGKQMIETAKEDVSVENGGKGDFKDKKRSLWQRFYDSGITSPSQVMREACILMYLKMLDDSQSREEANAKIVGVELKDEDVVFKKGDWTRADDGRTYSIAYDALRWKNFKDLGPDQIYIRFRDFCYPFVDYLAQTKHDRFSKTLGSVKFGFENKVAALADIVDMISAIDFTKEDALGDFFEQMIDGHLNGQFRTPRHIIDLMVGMIKPKIFQRIIDPAMGTAGFLIRSEKYIEDHQKNDLYGAKEHDWVSNEEFSGNDIDDSMVSIGCMNLLFHGVKNPNISQASLLETTNNADYLGKYDIVLANPPFGSTAKTPKNLVDPSITAITDTEKNELLFVALFVKLLKVGGYCACIIPDGVLFGGGKAYVSLRKEIVDHQKLIAVVSMPSGVFMPYSGVKTSFVIFQKTDCGGTDNVWFYNMENDGYSLDVKRNKTEANDIPDIEARFNNLSGEKNRTRFEKSFFVPKEEIESNCFNLCFSQYKKAEAKKTETRSFDEIAAEFASVDAETSELAKSVFSKDKEETK